MIRLSKPDLLHRIDQIEAEETAKWNAPRRPFAYQLHGLEQIAELREVEIDAVHKRKNTVRRWWSITQRTT